MQRTEDHQPTTKDLKYEKNFRTKTTEAVHEQPTKAYEHNGE